MAAYSIFFPGKFHGQRSLAGYNTWGCKESDTTEHTHTHAHFTNMSLFIGRVRYNTLEDILVLTSAKLNMGKNNERKDTLGCEVITNV